MPVMFAFLLAAAQADPPIIVTARPQTEKALADCLARKCEVRDDAIASIHHAQAQFADGDYPDARKTLLASLRRNRGKEDEDPRALSALWHALARVTAHNGDMVEYRKAALRSGSILARASSVTLAERVRGEVQIGDALSATGDPDGAVRRYRSVGEAARARGDQEVAELMLLRAIYARSTFDGRPAARRALERAAADTKLTALGRTTALSLAAQLQPGRAKAEELLAQVPVQGADAPPRLVYVPTNSVSEQREAVNRAIANGDGALLSLLLRPGTSRYRWADIGFWIKPDGRVFNAEVLRGSRVTDWTKDVLRSVQGRRYAPFVAARDSAGLYKIERVTLTFEQRTPTGSFIKRRSGLPSYRYEDLKVETAAIAQP